MEDRRRSDQQISEIFDLMREMRDEQREHRSETRTFMLDQVAIKKDVENLQADVKEMGEKVDQHHGVYVKGKALGALITLVLGWVGWDTVKNHLHWGGK
jgi:tetrahydromethanopterin S-methyltransferase subunit A